MSTLNMVVAVVAILLGGVTIGGCFIRYGLVPYLREQLIVPIQETHKQVTVNGGKSDPPTVLDRLHDLTEEVRDGRRAINETQAEILAMSRMYDKHLEWSQNEVDRIWTRLRQDVAKQRGKRE